MSKKLIFFVVASTLALCSSLKALDEQTLIDDFKAKLRTHLLTVGVTPVFGSNYQVGDIWDVTMNRLLERNSSCFPKLRTRKEDGSILAVTLKDSISVGLAFRLKQLFSLAGSGSEGASVTMYFEDVSDELASEGDLRQAFDAKACKDAAGVLNGAQLSANEAPKVVIGRLLRGKRRVVITYDDAASASIMAEKLASISVPVTVQATAAAQSGKTLTLVDKVSVPLAFSPAFVPVRTSGAPQGAGASQDVKYSWQPFSLERFPSEKESLSELGSATVWTWDDQDAQGK